MKLTLVLILALCAGCTRPVQKPRQFDVVRLRLALDALYSPYVPYEIYSQLPHHKNEMAEFEAEILRRLKGE